GYFQLYSNNAGDFCSRHGERIFQNEKAPVNGALRIASKTNAYLSAVWTLVKVVFNFEPRPCTTAMIATEIPAAMRPYSMAVAPDSSFTKRLTRFVMCNSL